MVRCGIWSSWLACICCIDVSATSADNENVSLPSLSKTIPTFSDNKLVFLSDMHTVVPVTAKVSNSSRPWLRGPCNKSLLTLTHSPFPQVHITSTTPTSTWLPSLLASLISLNPDKYPTPQHFPRYTHHSFFPEEDPRVLLSPHALYWSCLLRRRFEISCLPVRLLFSRRIRQGSIEGGNCTCTGFRNAKLVREESLGGCVVVAEYHMIVERWWWLCKVVGEQCDLCLQ